MDLFDGIILELIHKLDSRLIHLFENKTISSIHINSFYLENNQFEFNALLRYTQYPSEIISKTGNSPIKTFLKLVIEISLYVSCISVNEYQYYDHIIDTAISDSVVN